MSHFTKCELKMTNLAAIRAALEDLKLTYEEAAQGQQVVVRGYRGDTLKAAFKIDMGRYDIGVVKNEDGTYGLQADWWGIETTVGKTEQEVVDEINREYAYQTVVVACEAQGYRIEEQNVAEDGTIKLSVSKWG